MIRVAFHDCFHSKFIFEENQCIIHNSFGINREILILNYICLKMGNQNFSMFSLCR
mgnify:CR=1 FL=1